MLVGAVYKGPALFPPSILLLPGLLLLMALSPSEDLSRLSLLFEPVWLGSLFFLLHSMRVDEEGLSGLLPSPLLLQVLEVLLFLPMLA